jgi:RNA polymerase sigma-70 factor, ECF subfamily
LAPNDKEWYALIKAGDEKAFEALFREYYAILCAFARKFVQDGDVAEEMVQELFMQLWDKRQSLQSDTSIRSYLFTAVRNSCLNHIKHLSVRERHEAHTRQQAVPFSSDPLEALEQAELQARLHLAIEDLPDRCGEIFKLSRYEGLKYEEIAQQLQLSPRTVEVQIGKALRFLRKALAEWLPLLIIWLGAGYFY